MGDSLHTVGPVLETPPGLLRALRPMLRPLARMLLRFRIPYPCFSRLLKQIYVDAALADFADDSITPTDSRISFATGVHRKEVRRLRSQSPDDSAVPEAVSLCSQISKRWLTSPEYLDSAGDPKPLPRTSSAPEEVSFDRLVVSVSKDIRPRCVLDEWIRLGVAYIGTDEMVRLRVESFAPDNGFDEKAFYFGRNLGEHISSAAHNLCCDGPPLFERAICYEGLSRDSAQELEELSTRLARDLLQQVRRRAAECKERDARSADGSFRVALGVFLSRGMNGAGHDPVCPDRETRVDLNGTRVNGKRACDISEPGSRFGDRSRHGLQRDRAD